MNQSELGDRLRQIREERGLTQLDVVMRSGVQPSVYSRVETGVGNPTLKTLSAICRGLGITLQELFAPVKQDANKPDNEK